MVLTTIWNFKYRRIWKLRTSRFTPVSQ